MLKKIAIGIVAVLVLFLGYVATRSGHFHYERSGVINASPEKVYPYISEFRKGADWNPYEKKDPNMKKTYEGTAGQVGSKFIFEGNSEVGSGDLTVTKVEPNKSVEMTLHMTKPMDGVNHIVYTLTPVGEATKFTWSMSGDGGFPMKLLSVFMDCEKMIAGEMEKGIANLTYVLESKPAMEAGQ